MERDAVCEAVRRDEEEARAELEARNKQTPQFKKHRGIVPLYVLPLRGE